VQRKNREDVDHLIFTCAPSRFLWCCIRDILNWSFVPSNRTDLYDLIQTLGKDKRSALCLCVICSWAIWLTRNDFVFNNNIMKDVLQLPYKVLCLLMQWKSLRSPKVAGRLETLQDSLLAVIRKLGDQGNASSCQSGGPAPTNDDRIPGCT
jgi:hypothetical protein